MIDRQKDKQYHEMLNNGEMYYSVDDEFIAYQHELVQRLNEYNRTDETPEGLKERDEILREICGTYGEDLYVIPPVSANCGLRHVHFGKRVVVNFSCCFVDDGDIYIGDDTMIGPNCTLATSIHPVSPRLRKYKIQRNKQIHIGRNVWLGAGAIILPGVTIGDNSIVGAGSVVTKDVPANVIVVGNPARVLRQITENDDRFEGGKPIPQEMLDKYQ